MADIINSVDRSLDMYIYDLYIYIYIDISLLCEPNDAVRAVAVAKRREYAAISTLWRMDRFYKFVQISSSPTNSKPWPPTGNPPGVTGRLGTLAAPWTTRQYMYRIQTNGTLTPPLTLALSANGGLKGKLSPRGLAMCFPITNKIKTCFCTKMR